MKIVNDSQNFRILIVEDQFVEAHDLQIIIENAGYEVTGVAKSYREALQLIEDDKPDLVFLDIVLKGTETGIDLAKKLKDSNIGFIFISANSGKKTLIEAKKTQPYGFIVKPFREEDIVTTLEIACYRHKYSLESQLKQGKILKSVIDRISANTNISWNDAFLELGIGLQGYLPFDYFEAGFQDGHSYTMLGLIRKSFEEYQILEPEKISKISGMTIDDLAALQRQNEGTEALYNYSTLKPGKTLPGYKVAIIQCFGIRAFLSMDITVDGKDFNISFYSRAADSYENEHLSLLEGLQPVLEQLVRSVALKINAMASGKDITVHATVIPTASSGEFKGMVGNSKSMYTVYDHIRRVAPSDTSVLILGESGTGKEKIAKSIHQLSARKEKPLITINCGAIPENLAESILFGHEKGSFTGANEQRIGKFEMADGGTVFMDEIGELSNELQVKLLRVLQEKEIERVGSQYPIPVNIRVVAATNRNLEEEVAAGRFRLDLYYRLHVYPITIPALKDRKEDILDLASHFIQSYCEKNNRTTLSLSDTAISTLMDYDWPGNVRELENAVLRSIIMTEKDTIEDIHLSGHQEAAVEPKFNVEINEETTLKTFEENERDYITYVLQKCKGKIYGSGGAAEILNMPPTTLNSKLRKLGIR